MVIGVGDHDFGVYLVGFGFASSTFWDLGPNFGWGRGTRDPKVGFLVWKDPVFGPNSCSTSQKTPREKESGPKLGKNFFRNFHKGPPLWIEFRKIIPAKNRFSESDPTSFSRH